MKTVGMERLPIRFTQPGIQQLCPECGSKMVEVEQLNEDGAIFVWYKCSRKICNVQWLQKQYQEKISGFYFKVVCT